MSRGYPRIPIEEFGRHLLRTGDLDPVYLALPKAVEDADQLHRWLVAYWCFYNVGLACWMSEQRGAEFWRQMKLAAINEEPTPFGGRWPRAKERRHFRGLAALKAVDHLGGRYETPSDMLDFLVSGPMDIRSVIERAKTHYLVGDWLSFKIADMLDAVAGETVVQDDVSVFLYDTPRQSILYNWRLQQGLPETARPKDEFQVMTKSMEWLKDKLSGLTIPHKPGEPLDLFSLETVWCKHASHMSGHYPLMNDIHEIGEGLQPWLVHSGTAKGFLHFMPGETVS